jgi:hypothetical protein
MEAIRNYISDQLDQELRGLCITCDHRAACAYRKQSKKLIVQCELFSSPEAVVSPFMQAEPLGKRIARGLCDTCEHQRTCGFFKRNGYVWHCEEFA